MTLSRFLTALQVFEAFPALAGEMVSQPTEAAPLIFLNQLVGSASPEDAITFSAYLLDRRKAVWWASQCVRTLGSPRNRLEEVSINTAEAWVRDPEEHRRLAALDLGLNGDHELPGTWVALAAGGSGGTLRVNDQPGPPVPANMAARAAKAAVLIAIATVPIRERGAHITRCVAMCEQLLSRD